MRINGLQLDCKENVTSGDLVQEICPLSVPQKQLSLFELPRKQQITRETNGSLHNATNSFCNA